MSHWLGLGVGGLVLCFELVYELEVGRLVEMWRR